MARRPLSHWNKRFDVTRRPDISVAQAERDLWAASVKLSSATQYASRLRTLEGFLCTVREVSAAQAVTCTEEEFTLFLWMWKEQGMGPANAFRAALLREHRAAGLTPSFLEKATIKKLVGAAGQSGRNVDKGVLTSDMFEKFSSFVSALSPEVVQGCNGCRHDMATHGWAALRCRLILAARLMFEAPLRPSNLKDFRREHLVVHRKSAMLYVTALKTKPQGGWEPVSDEAVRVFTEACALAASEYVFPRCTPAHLTDLLRRAEVSLEWTPGLVFTAHCLRHSGMSRRGQEAAELVAATMGGVSVTTQRHYARPLGKRRRGE